MGIGSHEFIASRYGDFWFGLQSAGSFEFALDSTSLTNCRLLFLEGKVPKSRNFGFLALRRIISRFCPHCVRILYSVPCRSEKIGKLYSERPKIENFDSWLNPDFWSNLTPGVKNRGFYDSKFGTNHFRFWPKI